MAMRRVEEHGKATTLQHEHAIEQHGDTHILFAFLPRPVVPLLEAIRAFRKLRSPPGDRRILKSVITTYGSDFADARPSEVLRWHLSGSQFNPRRSRERSCF